MPAGQESKVKNYTEVIDEARRERKTVHVATLMDLCHLENAEFGNNFKKYKRRVVLRGHVVKDGSGSYAVFIEQGSF